MGSTLGLKEDQEDDEFLSTEFLFIVDKNKAAGCCFLL